MKKLLCLIVLILAAAGKIYAADISALATSNIPLDKGDDAVVLYSSYDVTISPDGNRHASVEELVRIVTQTGRDGYADKNVFVDKNFGDIKLNKGGTYLPDGSFVPLEKAGINETTSPALSESQMYGSFVNNVFSFASADPGSNVYIKYDSTKNNTEEKYDSDIIILQSGKKNIE